MIDARALASGTWFVRGSSLPLWRSRSGVAITYAQLPTGEIGDVVFNLQPALEGRRQTTSSDLRLAATANLIRYARYDRENVTTFRGLADWRGDVAPRQSSSVTSAAHTGTSVASASSPSHRE